MKILISAYACNPNYGSESGYGWRRAVSAALEGHDVHCLTSSRAKDLSLFDERLRELNITNLKFIFIDVPDWVEKAYRYQPGVYLHYLVWQHKAYRVAKRLHEEVGFHLIHHITIGSLQMASELWKLGIPMIFGPVGGGQMAPVAFKRYFENSWKQEKLRKWTSGLLMMSPNTKGTINNASYILVSNPETFDLVIKHKPQKIIFFPDAHLPDSFYTKKIPERSFATAPLKLLWLGRLFPRKGLKLVLEALSKATVPFKLTVVGDGPLRNKAPKWIEQYGVKDKVVLKGKIPWKKVNEAYLEHDVFIFCSLRDSIGVQLLEAMALGLPIITLNINGSKSFVPEQAGIKVPVTNPEETAVAIAKAVEHMYAHPEKRREYGENAFAYAQNFKESITTKKFEELYAQAAKASIQNG